MRSHLALGLVAVTALSLVACEAEQVAAPDVAPEESPAPIESPAEEPSPTPERVDVPDITGVRLADARRIARGLDLRVTVSKKSSDEDPGTVISQRPSPGASRSPGGIIRLVVAKPKPEPAPAENCQGYSPCIPPGPDVDCAGGSGDGPRYTGPVRVSGSDPYGLDADGDGYGCES